MFRFIVSMALAVVCLFVIGCTEEPPDELLTPDLGGVSASRMAKPDKLPSVYITLPLPTGLNPALVPPVFYVLWEAQRTKSVRWILINAADFNDSWLEAEEYIRNNPDAPEWSEWTRYKPKKDQGDAYYPPPQDFGRYVFAVQAKSPPGDTTDIIRGVNMARLLVSQRTTGPVLKVINRYIGPMITAVTTAPPWIIDIPSNVPMVFSLTADASAYGAYVNGYRWGWDLIDPDDESEWPMAFTPFVSDVAEIPPSSFMAGTHTVYIEVIDTWGYKSRIAVQVNIVAALMNRPLLLVDDWEENSPGWAVTNGAVPSDEEHDQFWLAMVGGVDGFDRNGDVIEVDANSVPSLDMMLNYRSIVWNSIAFHNGSPPTALGEFLDFRDPNGPPAPAGLVQANILALYMAAGGHVLLCGEQIMTASVNRESFHPQNPVYPLIFRYELSGEQDGDYEDSELGVRGIGDQSFPYDDCCLNVLDIGYVPSVISRRRSGVNNCPVDIVRTHNPRNDGLRHTIPVGVGSGFSAMNLRPETAGPGRFFAPEHRGLNCDVYNPPYFAAICDVAELFPQRSCFEPIWAHGCLDEGSAIYGAPIAFWTSTYADRVPDNGGVAAKSAIWGFQPVYFNPDEVKTAIDIVLFDEWQLPRPSAALGIWGSPDAVFSITDTQPGQLLPIYVVYRSAVDAAGVEFSAPLPACATGMTYLTDEHVFPATTGNSQTGVAVDFGGCLSGSVHALTIYVYAQGLSQVCCYYPVQPHSGTGQIRAMGCSGMWSEAPTAMTFINDDGTCGVPPGSTTWSRIQSLDK
ncbi:MAG: hypothetical protein JSW50_11480 [Candidatus Latescibacterota bacterium]|nr:MAG: hypothetical protein JSW50_11480 [Candidatus Latescibacterota bacterium]